MRWFVQGFLCFVSLFFVFNSVVAWGNDKVRLADITTLTLHHGKMTTGRRSSSIPQIKCIGGSAGCSSFVPQVIQCYNRGSDGYDVQWECKTDMDNAFRFGRVDVLCEGYDHPEDPFVLKGSCGMEYTLDLTKEGMQGQSGHSYYQAGDSYNYPGKMSSKSNTFGNLILVAIVLLIMYAIYRTCLRQHQYSPGNDDFNNPDNRHGSGFGYPSGPTAPPPGFRSDFGSDAGCGGAQPSSSSGAGTGNFWTGAMAGGVLGYLFGNNRNRDYQYGEYRQPNNSWGSFSSRPGPSFSAGSSTGTRTASGYGGTRRR